MNSSNQEYSERNRDDKENKKDPSFEDTINLEHKIKLSNAIPLTLLFLTVAMIVTMFESSLKATYSEMIEIKLSSAKNEDSELEEHEIEQTVSPSVKFASETVFSAVSLDNLEVSHISELVEVSRLTENEKLQTLALVVKKLRQKKYYEQSLAIIISLSQSQQEDFVLLFSKAYNLAKLGHKDAAAISYKRLLELQPQNQAAAINLGFLYLSLQDYVKAMDIFTLGIKHSSGAKKAKHLSGLAAVQVASQDYENALNTYQKAIEYRPDYSLGWRNVARVAVIMNNHVLARDSYQKAVALEPKNLIARLQLVSYLMSRLDYSNAVKHLLKAKSIDRESFQIRLKLAFAYLHARKPINARKQLTLARKNIQQPHEKFQAEAMLLFLDRRYKESIKRLKTNISDNIKKSGNMNYENYMIAMNYAAMSRIVDSKKYFDRLSKDSNYYPAGQYLLAEAYIDNNQTEPAAELFGGLTTRITDNSKLFLQAAKAFQIGGYFTRALGYVDKALVLTRSKQLLLRRADLLWSNNRTEESIHELVLLIDEYPNYLRARYHLANYNHKIGNNLAAISAFSELLDIRASYGDAQYQLGLVYFEQRQFTDSLPLLKDYLLEKSDSKRTRLLYARTFCELGQALECKEQLKLVIKLEPNYAPALDLLKKLKNSHP